MLQLKGNKAILPASSLAAKALLTKLLLRKILMEVEQYQCDWCRVQITCSKMETNQTPFKGKRAYAVKVRHGPHYFAQCVERVEHTKMDLEKIKNALNGVRSKRLPTHTTGRLSCNANSTKEKRL